MSTSTQEEIVASAGSAAPAAPPTSEEDRMVAEMKANLMARVEAGMKRGQDRAAAAAAAGAQNRLGQVIVNNYVSFDLYGFTPMQIDVGPPPYLPNRILAAGDRAVIFAVLFVNPAVDVANGFAIPPTVQLGGRKYQVGLEQVNITDVLNDADDLKVDTFSSPAPSFTLIDFRFTAPNVGAKPRFIEAHLFADIVDPGQPYAAFASTITDVDTWQVQENIPIRYLVYPQ